MNKKTADYLMTGVFGFIFCICLLFIVKDIINYRSAQKEYKKLGLTFPLKNDRTVQNPGNDDTAVELKSSTTASKFEELYKINPDLVGILSIPSLNLLYPVVQGADNEKYLNITFEGKKNPAGCLFMDCQNNNTFMDDNTYIYGHNMKDGSMFGSLKKMTREDFDYKNASAYIITKSKTYSYKFEKAEVVNVNEYKASKNKQSALTLYTCWSNDKKRRLLVTFLRDEG